MEHDFTIVTRSSYAFTTLHNASKPGEHMAKMDDDQLLELLRRKEEDASAYVHGQLGTERELSLREYYRLPYGNEEEGQSQIVSSDIQDTIEWILPSLLKIFTSTDKAVSFEPTRANDVHGAEQATEACNYVFYKANNGFLTLYTALKDGLMVRNAAVMWRKEDKETVTTVPFKGATQEMLAMLMQEQDAEIQEVNEAPMVGPDGQPVLDMLGQPVIAYNGRLKKTEKRQVIKVESFPPENLLIDRAWTSPLLSDCPYVCREMLVTLSELKEMGFKVEPEDLRASDQVDISSDADFRLGKVNQDDIGSTLDEQRSDDDSQAEGWLRIEYVLADIDGDGIAERVCVYRLRDKILSRETCSHVPIATFSPILNPHRWDGMSMADVVSDLQRLHTELLRQTVNSAVLANNPRTKVLTDSNGAPYANIDDLLDSRAGGVLRMTRPDAVTEQVTPFVAGATMPLLEYVQAMRENRTGVSRTSMGLNPDSLNNTATGRQIDQSAAMQRIELIARVAAETLVKPIFQGILKLLTDGGMEKIAFRLRDEFVEYDPNEWRDSYDMTINVGLGSGDAAQKTQQLTTIYQMQMAGLQMGLATPKHLYHTAAKLIENAGFKDVQNFVQDPSTLPPAPPAPPIEVQLEQMKQQGEAQKFQAQSQQELQKFQAETQMTREVEQIKAQAKLQEIQANLELQASNDARDGERETLKAQLAQQVEMQRLEFEKWKAELAAQTQIYIEQLKLGSTQTPQQEAPDLNNALAASIDGFRAALETMARPKTIIRGPDGRAQGIQ